MNQRLISCLTAALLLFEPSFPLLFAAETLELTNGQPVPVTSFTQETLPGPEASPQEPQDSLMDDAALTEATGAAYHVSTAGSDESDGSETSPWRSIQFAVNRLAPGDVLFIEEGTYEEYVTFPASGTAEAPITIEGRGNVIINAQNLTFPNPQFPSETLRRVAFNTSGQDFLTLRNLSVVNAGGGIQVSAGSSNIEIDGFKTDNSRFGVQITDASNVTVRNSEARNSWNGFRADGTSSGLLFENVSSYFSKDNFSSLDINYINGDGFLFEAQTSNITIRNAVSAHHWDSGFDIKAGNVLVENAVSFGNKNGFKTWGPGIRLQNILIYDSRGQLRPSGVTIEGFGVNVIQGDTTISNATIADTFSQNIVVRAAGNLTLTNSIIARRGSGALLAREGALTVQNNLWFREGQADAGFALEPGDVYADPQFEDPANFNYHLKAGSPAVDQGAPESGMPSAADPRTSPPPANSEIITGLANGQTVSGRIFVETQPASGLEIMEVRYFVDGVHRSRQTQPPHRFGGAQGFDTATLSDGAHTLTVLVLAKNQNILPFNIPFQVNNSAQPPPSPGEDFTGLSSGQTVSGVITVQPNLAKHPTIRKVFYYLDGAQSGKQYASPFTWGGASGFDTRTLSNGNHTLSGSYTDSTGDHPFSINFTAANGTTPPPPPPPQDPPPPPPPSGACTAAVCGVSNGQTVSGTLFVKPNLESNPSVRKVSYYLNGGLSDRQYAAPFQWKGSAGFDTRTLSNGTYTLSGAYTTSTGDQNFSIPFTVNNSSPPPPPPSPPPPPPPPPAGDFTGLSSGQTVSGVITVQPNLQQRPTIRKVFYYLNGTQSGKQYAAPFTWGGSAGFDTRTISNGNYTLSGSYTDSTGDHPFSIPFSVNN